MAITKIDSTELEYLRSCRDKLQDIIAVLNIKERQEEKQDKKETSTGEKLKEIEKIIKS